MALEKLKISPQRPSNLGEIEVLFNPNSYSITKGVTWSPAQPPSGRQETETHSRRNAPILEFGGGGSRQLTLELFFDVTENPSVNDVRQETNRIVALTRIEAKQGRPPVCLVSWGSESPTGSDFPFRGVVVNLRQRFTLFTSEGRPIRANLTVLFKEFLSREEDQRQTDPELTTQVVQRGDTLSGITAKLYHDPRMWRTIAEANNLDDPRQLQIGQRLVIPRVR